MRRRNQKLFGVFWMIFVFILVSAAFAGAFYLTGYLFPLIKFHPTLLLSQIINSLLGLVITGAILSIFSRIFVRQQRNAFLPLIEAMNRIAKGDFSIHLEDEEENGFLNSLIGSVNKMALDLGQMENMRQEFVSNVSHEIQTPLTSIRGFAQLLQNENLSQQERQHYLEIIESESKRLSRLTDDLLNLATLDSDQIKFEPKDYALDKQIRSLILICEPQWSVKKINIELSLSKISILADEDLLSQVWINLLHNSIKFTPVGGNIKIDLHIQEKQVIFTITDSGIGISPEDQVHIFERFYKADKSRTRVKEGSGLGLSIVKKIVDLHQGTIDVISEPGSGATFKISLPHLNSNPVNHPIE